MKITYAFLREISWTRLLEEVSMIYNYDGIRKLGNV